MRKPLLITSVLLVTTGLAGCNLAPAYIQPEAPVAPQFPEYAVAPSAAPQAADLDWREFFTDPRLKALIATALERNRDLAQSYARIEQARAQYRIQDSQRLPALDADGNATRTRQSGSSTGSGNAAEFSQFGVSAGVSAFELDLWGRVRNLSEGQRQRYFATIEGTQTFRVSLIAQVAATYFDIRAGEERIELARRSLEGRREGLRIARLRLDAGVTSTIDYDQTVLLLTQAQTELAGIQRTTEQSRNLLDVLLGGPISGTLPAGTSLRNQVRDIAPGLPSALLVNRPDVRQAEHELRGANADIGAARAAFFPTISLTGNLGFVSNELDALFKGSNNSWSFGGLVSLPIFDWGRRKAELKLSKARADELVAAYQGTVQTAFREVADALVGRQRYAEQIEAQVHSLEAQQRLARAARLRYDNGIAIYLEVLDAERNLFSASQQLVQLQATQLQNDVSLYVALGGGQEAIQR